MRMPSLRFAWPRTVIIISVLVIARIAHAQMPENLSNDPEGADTLMEQIFRPYFFDPIEDTTQWSLQWRNYYLNRRNDGAADNEAFTTGLLATGQESFSGISEAYLDWGGYKLNLTAGRMKLETPFRAIFNNNYRW